MIQEPRQQLQRRGAATLTIVLVAALAMALPGALALVALVSQSVASSWVQAYEPVVYFAQVATAEDRARLVDELVSLDGVAEVVARSPEDALTELRERMGPERVQTLGVDPAMLPYSARVLPAVTLHGHIALAATIASWEVRPEVDAVDVPGASAMRVLLAARTFAAVGVAVMLALALAVLGLVMGYLGQLLDDERAQLALLERFGAPRASLLRPTLLRGFWLGAWAGAAASVTLLALLLLTQHHARAVFGVHAVSMIRAWLVIAMPLALGPASGLLAGLLAVSAPGIRATLRRAGSAGSSDARHQDLIGLTRFDDVYT
ncbi:MAG: permease-like cell division protein FtsX [Myxococcota bacterium]